jgi:hypothetical protein
MHTDKFSVFLKKALPAIKHQSPKLMLAADAAPVFVAAKSVEHAIAKLNALKAMTCKS